VYNCPIARLPDCPIARLPDCPIARLRLVLKIAFGNFKLAICGVLAVRAFLSNIEIILS